MSDIQSLATRTVRGLFWTGSAFALQIATTLVFYRLLGAERMGGFEWALLLVMLAALLCDLGLGSALVQDREAGDEHFDAAFWTCLAFGSAVTALVLVLAPALAAWLSREETRDFETILSRLVLLVPFAAVSGVFRARLQRDLRWRAMAAAEIAASCVHAALSFALLAAGLGILSVVYGALAREVVLLLGLAVAGRWLPRPALRLAALRRIAAFGLNLTGSRCLQYLGSNLPRLFIYPLLGEAAMGHFSFAYRLTLLPLVRLSTVITRVFFPTFSAIQEETDLLRRAYLRSVSAMALGYWPVLAGLALLAEPVVTLTRPDMAPAVWPLRLLALATLVKAAGTGVGSVFLACGRANWALYWALATLAVLVPALYWAVGHGVAGVAAAILLTSLLFLALSQHLANRLLEMGFADYLAVLWRPGLVAASVAVALGATSPWWPAAPLAACAAGGLAAAIGGLAGVRLFAWDDLREMWRSVRGG